MDSIYTVLVPFVAALVLMMAWALVASTTHYLDGRSVGNQAKFALWYDASALRMVSYSLRNGRNWIEYEHTATGTRFIRNGRQWCNAHSGKFVSYTNVLKG